MKKQVSFIVRLTSLILTLLLLFTMTIGTGITTVFAKEYKESSYLDVAELAVGDIVGANTVIHWNRVHCFGRLFQRYKDVF